MDVRTPGIRNYRPTTHYPSLRDLLSNLPKAVDAALVADVLAECATPGDTLIVGVTGSVAAGKTTFCTAITEHLRSTTRVEIVSTDGFLLSNETLAARGLLMRKGFPESYDHALLSGTLQRLRWGAVRVPGYSHTTYDRAPDLDRTITRPDIVLVEGLGLSPRGGQRNPAGLLDLLIYIDAQEADLEAWFVRRFMKFWRDAKTNPSSFYARFQAMEESEAEAFASKVWTEINLPNLRDYIAPARDIADITLSKSFDHSMRMDVHARAQALI